MLDVREIVRGYSYWTFSDIFEENYFSSAPFHGGFGLLTIDGVPKPAYRAFELLHRLGDESLAVRGEHPTVDVWVTRKGRALTLMATNGALPRHAIRTELVSIELRGLGTIAHAVVARIDEEHANPRRAWIAMGRPARPLPMQVVALEDASRLVTEPADVRVDGDCTIFELVMPPQSTLLLSIELG